MDPSVTPVAAKITSLVTISSREYILLKSFIPVFIALFFSISFLNISLPCIFPPTHFNAAAARTPSGAPPLPIYMSTPVFSVFAQCITPATSPSVINLSLAPVARISSIKF